MSTTELIELLEHHHKSAVVLATVKLGIFAAATTPKTAQELSEETGAVTWKLEVLLDTLTAMGLMHKSIMDRYETVASVQDSLIPGSKHSITSYCQALITNWNCWEKYSEILQTDERHNIHQDFTDKQYAEAFYKMQEQTNFDMFQSIGRQISLENIDVLIDIGGGNGAFVSYLAKKTEEITFEIWDLPHARLPAQKTIERNNLQSRVTYREYKVPDDFPDSGIQADAISMLNLTHHLSLREFETFVRLSRKYLSDDSNIIIGDTFLYEDGTGPLGNLLFSNYLLLNNPGARLHKLAKIVAILHMNGFGVKTSIASSDGFVTLIHARKENHA